MWVSPIIAKARFQAMQFLEPRFGLLSSIKYQ